MKRYREILAVGLIICAAQQVVAGAKRQWETNTKLEEAAKATDRLLYLEIVGLGSLSTPGSTITFATLTVYEPGQENSKVRGITVKIQGAERYGSSEPYYIDQDELVATSKAVQAMADYLATSKPKDNSGILLSFQTKDGFKIGFAQAGDKNQVVVTTGPLQSGIAYLSQDDLKSLKAILDRAISQLGIKT